MKDSKIFIKLVLVAAIVACGLLAFFFGFQLGGKVDPRAPAALHKTFDYSVLPETQLKVFAGEHLVGGFKTFTAGNTIGVTLGHFSIRDKDGKNFTACQKYSKVELTYEAGDMAVSGELPQMIMEGDCVPDYEVDKISPLYVDYGKVLTLKVGDKLLNSFSVNNNTVRFVNVSDEWPRLWVLSKIRLYSPGGEELVVNDDDIRQYHGQALTMEWPH